MQKKPFIPIILGTARVDRRSEQVAKYVYSVAKTFPIQTKVYDVADFVTVPRTIPPWEKESKAITSPWQKIAKRANGFLLVTPEYNHSYPGELKLLLDMAYSEYKGKPVGLISVSQGGFGGARVVEHLQPVLANFGMIHVLSPVYVSHVGEWREMDSKKTESMYGKKITLLTQELLSYI